MADNINYYKNYDAVVCTGLHVYNELKALLELSNKWHLDPMKLTFILSPTLILESPSASTTRGSPSFSI